jgi:mRNA-degrading endonuclease RelE of RelBE toxin-antitoxin system
MNWTVILAKRARKEFARAPAKSQRLLRAALEEMRDNPFSGDIVRLASEQATWRRRVGSFWIFFDVHPDQQRIDIVNIVRRTSTTY